MDSSERAWKPDENDEQGIALCAEIFEDVLRGHPLVANNSRWIRFSTVRTRSWRDGNVLLSNRAAVQYFESIGLPHINDALVPYLFGKMSSPNSDAGQISFRTSIA